MKAISAVHFSSVTDYRIAQPVSSSGEERNNVAVKNAGLQEETQSSGKKGKVDDRVAVSKDNLTEEERRQVEKLRQRDQEVRAHEQAHIAAGGQYVRGGASFQYERGPDGKLYAVGGEVSIDVSPVPNNPSATIRKMETVIRAALAPSQPSGQDYQVAARAQAEISKAQMELLKKQGREAYSAPGKNLSGSGKSQQTPLVSIIA